MFGCPHVFGHPPDIKHPLILAAHYVWTPPLMPQMSPYFQTPPCMSLGVEFSFNFLQWHLSLCLDAPMHLNTPLMPQMSPYFQTPPCMSLGDRNLSLIFFSGMYVLHLGGMWVPPVYFHAPMHSDAPNAPLYIPNASLCICMFMGYLNRNGGCGDSPSVWTSPMCCMPPHLSNTPAYLYAALHVCLSRPQHPPKAELLKSLL